MSSIGGEEEREAISSVLAVVDELYRIRDTYFPRDPEEKTSRLRALVDTALSLLDSLPPGTHLFLLYFHALLSINPLAVLVQSVSRLKRMESILWLSI
ncbi:hypothetical protein ZIOFF_011646 [Zingiber officinale]|uniref:Uncharacterized protein n=1 Tax=Zingiber officinale TaxID=94328 RepID=A0A8J5HRA0_ZINOF|nr:hypothetical protein ZIOFF_011646 [Zingiber officinale]